MEKKVKSFEKVYGNYIDAEFVTKVRDLSREAQNRAMLNRNEQVYKDLHNPDCGHAGEAVAFWSAIHDESRLWLRDNSEEPLTGKKKIASSIMSILKGMKCK